MRQSDVQNSSGMRSLAGALLEFDCSAASILERDRYLTCSRYRGRVSVASSWVNPPQEMGRYRSISSDSNLHG